MATTSRFVLMITRVLCTNWLYTLGNPVLPEPAHAPAPPSVFSALMPRRSQRPLLPNNSPFHQETTSRGLPVEYPGLVIILIYLNSSLTLQTLFPAPCLLDSCRVLPHFLESQSTYLQIIAILIWNSKTLAYLAAVTNLNNLAVLRQINLSGYPVLNL